jgi:RNA polymerase sigma factor (sigma-70 family)
MKATCSETDSMSRTRLPPILYHLRTRFRSCASTGGSDEQLLGRFVTGNEEAAFEELLLQHASLVWGVCRRMLNTEEDAEDAFQATFLVLASRAPSIRKQASISSWLHGVAHRIALKVRAEAQRRSQRELRPKTSVQADALTEASWKEIQAILDEEIGQLPGWLRTPLVLCCLEGHGKAEAARLLGCKEGTLSSRLARARQRLRVRLARRGVAVSVASLAALLAENASPAAVPLLVLAATQKMAVLIAAGKSASAGGLSSAVASLVHGTLHTMFVTKIKVGASVLLAVTLLAASAALMAQQDFPDRELRVSAGERQQPAPQQATDGLPQGVVARLGTAHARAVCDSLCFSPDGQKLVGIDGGRLIRVWDAASGNLLETRRLSDTPYRGRWAIRTVRSSDGNTLLICQGSSLEMWDIVSGKRLNVPLPRGRKRLDALAMSDDRRLLFLGETVKSDLVPGGGGFGRIEQQENLLLWDTTTGTLRLFADDESMLVALAIAPNGQRLASSSGGKGTRVWDTATRKLLWAKPKFNAEQLTFTPDGQNIIAAPGGGQSSWHVWEAATGRSASGFHAPTVGYAWTFAASPEGSQLLIPTSTDYVLWDLKAGRMLHRWPGANQGGKGVFAPDGRSVITSDAVLQRWDLRTGKLLYADVSALGHVAPVRRLFFTPDGRRLVSVGEDYTICIWDVSACQLVHTLGFGQANPEAWDFSSDGGSTNRDGWTITPDGTTLVGVNDRLTLHQWSVADGRLRKTYDLAAAKDLDIRLRVLHVRVAPDGKKLVAGAWPRCPEYRYSRYSFSFWDMPTGRLECWGGDPGPDFRGDFATLSPDGWLAARDGKLVDTQTGAAVRLEEPEEASTGFVFSPDSRWLAANEGKGVRVLEVATGRRLIDLPQATTRCAAFSPDGRRFAFAGADRLIIWDLQRGKIVVDQAVPEYLLRDCWASASVVFSPDGRTLVTGHPDGSILLWEVPRAGEQRRRLIEREATALWDDLASSDPARAYAAVWAFREDPQWAVQSLTKHFAAGVLSGAKEWQALLRGLDSDQFEDREAASRRLAALGRAADGGLRAALKNHPTAEQKRRIEALLAIHEPYWRARSSDLRAARAVAVLEGINTEASRQLLQEWARRLPGTWLADEASRALARLTWRPPIGPK